MCPNNSLTNADGSCTCLPGYMNDGAGNCVAFDYATTTPAGTPAGTASVPQWKKILNQYGPLVLGGVAGWWTNKNNKPTDTTPAGTPAVVPPKPDETDKGVPVWVWIGGGVALLLIVLLVVRNKK